MDTGNTNVKNLSFESALEQLEAIVEGLEQGHVALEKSIEQYERGEALRNHCKALLAEAENKVERIKLNSNGGVKAVESLDS